MHDSIIANAFQWASDIRNSDKETRDDYRWLDANLSFPKLVAYYIDCYADDRRYKLQWNAADTSYTGAIVTYRKIRYYVYGSYTPPSSNGFTRGYRTYSAERTSR